MERDHNYYLTLREAQMRYSERSEVTDGQRQDLNQKKYMEYVW